MWSPRYPSLRMRGTLPIRAERVEPVLRTRRVRWEGQAARIEVALSDRGSGATATILPEGGPSALSAAFIRRAVAIAAAMSAEPMLISSPAITTDEATGFAAAGFRVTSELHLLAHDLDARPPQAKLGSARLRRGSGRDVPAVLAIDAAAFAPSWALTPGGLAAARSATPITRFRVAADDQGAHIGYAVTGRAGRRGYLQRLAVAPSHQRAGVGASLVHDAITWCVRHHVRRLVVNTQVGNDAALALYHRLGFADVPTRLCIMERWAHVTDGGAS